MKVRQIAPINEVFAPGQLIAFLGPDSMRPAEVYADPALVVQSNNPVVADANGRVARVYTDRDDVMWLPRSY